MFGVKRYQLKSSFPVHFDDKFRVDVFGLDGPSVGRVRRPVGTFPPSELFVRLAAICVIHAAI